MKASCGWTPCQSWPSSVSLRPLADADHAEVLWVFFDLTVRPSPGIMFFYREIIPKWPWNIIIYPVSVLICSRMMFPIRYGRFYLVSKVTVCFCVRLEFIVRFTSITSRREILQASKQVLFSLQVGKLWWRVHPPKSKLGLIKGNIISL